LTNVDADIVGLQELAPGQATAIETYLTNKYPYRVLVPTGFSGKGLLSRFPILESASVDLAPERPDLNASIEILGRNARSLLLIRVLPGSAHWRDLRPGNARSDPASGRVGP
jgi:hypothetical protein